MHNFVYLAQRLSQEFSCEPNFGAGAWRRGFCLLINGGDACKYSTKSHEWLITTTDVKNVNVKTLGEPPRSTRSSSLVTHHLFYEEQIVPFGMVPVVSVINSRLLSVNHALNSPVLRVALSPLVPSSDNSHHPSPLHSFIPGLKTSFSADPSHGSLLLLLHDSLHRFLGQFTDTSKHIRFYFLRFFPFSLKFLIPFCQLLCAR